MQKNNIILSDLIDLNSPRAVYSGVKKIFSYHYSLKFFKEIEKCYKQIRYLFEGKLQGYNACNTKYHNLRHTMDVFLATARLMDGYNLNEEPLPERLAINLLKSSLFHDSGYIQEIWDTQGTGAKYTPNHIGRSIAFIVKHRGDLALSKEDVDSISKLIRCTEIKYKLNTIPFSTEEERAAGIILGSADILGQVSDREYLERLLFLYNELKEADVPGYKTEFDIIKSTLKLYKTVKKRLDVSFKKVYHYAEYHFRKRFNYETNLYVESMEKNIQYLEKIINDKSTNFRQKLRRGKKIDEFDLSMSEELKLIIS